MQKEDIAAIEADYSANSLDSLEIARLKDELNSARLSRNYYARKVGELESENKTLKRDLARLHATLDRRL